MFLITHSGAFHCDEVTSTAIFTLIYDKCILLRTRDLKLIQALIDLKIHESEYHLFFSKYKELLSSNSSISVYDVFGKYDPTKNIYDHHQKGFFESFYKDKFQYVKMSSAGLVFKHFGKSLIKSIMENCELFKSVNIKEFIESKRYNELIEYIYEYYFLGIDASDNGIEDTEATPVKERLWSQMPELYNTYDYFGASKKYTLENISAEYLRSTGIAEKNATEDEKRNISFNRAVEVSRQDLEFYLKRKIYTFAIEYEIVLKQISIAEQYEGGQIVYWKRLADKKGVDFNDDVMFRKKMQIEHLPKAKFFIYQPSRTGDFFRIYGAAVDLVSNKDKAYLKKEWRGLRGPSLVRVSSLKNIVFVHASGFTGAAKDLTTSIKMCVDSL
ncbi:UPF0160 protein MYG1, mitochondrial [Cucumispora dikerogammari]|nr:UPF0160 protein MYG1, mitochondrial [Cucumispora dikerogammari]